MAAALIQVNQKLDAIQKTQQKMFEYLRERDKAELRGSFQALTDIMCDYRFNWQNETFLANAHMKVLDIRERADSASTHLRAQIRNELGDKRLLETSFSVEDRLEEILDRFAEYRLATHLYAFASFLEPLFSGNFDEEYLASVAERISAHALSYRELYTECYESIDTSSKGSIASSLIDGISAAGKAIGGFISRTPLGKHTSVGSAVTSAGKNLGRLNEKRVDSLMARLRAAKSPDVLSFQQGVESLCLLYNRPVAIATDSEGHTYLPTST